MLLHIEIWSIFIYYYYFNNKSRNKLNKSGWKENFKNTSCKERKENKKKKEVKKNKQNWNLQEKKEKKERIKIEIEIEIGIDFTIRKEEEKVGIRRKANKKNPPFFFSFFLILSIAQPTILVFVPKNFLSGVVFDPFGGCLLLLVDWYWFLLCKPKYISDSSKAFVQT